VAATRDVQIRFHISGGIAGIDYALLVDGSSGSVLGESCSNGCSFDAGDTLLGVADDQIQDWGDRLLAAGILALDGTDYGTGCCDRFHVELSYTDGLGTTSIRGLADLMPPAIQSVVNELAGLVSETLSIIVDPALHVPALPADPVQILGASIAGSLLSVDLEFSGGCTTHAFALFLSQEWMESFPVQIVAFLAHDDRDDACDGIVRRTVRFRLQPLEQAYVAAYPGEAPGERRVVLHVVAPDDTSATLTHTF
jgi:hypothetical protein